MKATRVAVGGVAVAALFVAVAGVWAHGQILKGHRTDARAGLTPWAIAVFFVAIASEVLALRRRDIGGRGVLARVATVLLTASLAVLTVFFVGVAITGRFGPAILRGDNAVTALFTLAISLALFVGLPLSLVLFAIVIARDRSLAPTQRAAPAGIVIVSVIGAATFAAAPEANETAIAVAWVLTTAALFALLGFGVG